MAWDVKYLPEVHDDLASLDGASVKRVEKVIEKKIINGNPDKLGKPLRKELTDCRRFRVGDIRIVYKIFEKEVQVLVVAVGMRRDSKIYDTATAREPRELPMPKTATKKKTVKKKPPFKPK